MKYYYQDYIGKTVEISKYSYYKALKEWADSVRVEKGDNYRKLVCIKFGA